MIGPNFPLQSPISGGNILERGWLQAFAELGRILSGTWGRGAVVVAGGRGKISATPFHALVMVSWEPTDSIAAGSYKVDGYSFDFGVVQCKRGATEYSVTVSTDGKLIFPTIPAGTEELVLNAYLSIKDREI